MSRNIYTIFSIIVLSLFFACNNSSKEESRGKSIPKNLEKKYPELKFGEDFFDLGSIKGGEVVSHTFHFQNTGNDVLIIKDIIPDCGCTQPKIDKKELSPGEEGTIEIIFDSKGWHGSQFKSVTLRTNAPIREKSITIKANIID
jgi:hypothetical protein